MPALVSIVGGTAQPAMRYPLAPVHREMIIVRNLFAILAAVASFAASARGIATGTCGPTDGSLTAARVNVGLKGRMPPM
jgi:hypothetical protein